MEELVEVITDKPVIHGYRVAPKGSRLSVTARQRDHWKSLDACHDATEEELAAPEATEGEPALEGEAVLDAIDDGSSDAPTGITTEGLVLGTEKQSRKQRSKGARQ